jgi:solute:Na+ symporter, SSS family
MNVALVIIFIFLALAVYLGIRARRGKDMDLEEWAVGGRGFGAIFIFLLLAGEIYTTFTFLGGSGWAYGEGGPAFYILSYGCLAYVMSYWLLPAVWRYSKENRLHSQADFFASKYESPALGVLVSLVAVVAMVPYLALQFQGLGLIVSEASYGAISSTVAAIIGTVAVTVYVIISGIHGSAWTAVVKDIMVLVVVVFMGIYLPFALYGGIGEMFREIQAQKPGFLILPSEGYSPSWFVSTVLLTALGFYMWPHTFGSVFTAENARVIRRNATYLPPYRLSSGGVTVRSGQLAPVDKGSWDRSKGFHMHYGACLCGQTSYCGWGIGSGEPESGHWMSNGADARSILDMNF